ncbi:hydrogenase maturation protease [bacterium]|nr:hydrogenase maturation protease [bacterium]
MTNILIAGIGNIFFGDDAFGCEVIKKLYGRQVPENVRVVDFGIRGFDLAYALMDDHYDVAILVDALPRGGKPGTLYTIEPEMDAVPAEDTAVETHGMNPIKVFQLIRAMGGQVKRVLIVGCEPETLGPEEGLMGLSQPVEAAVDEAVQLIESLVESFTNKNQLLT